MRAFVVFLIDIPVWYLFNTEADNRRILKAVAPAHDIEYLAFVTDYRFFQVK